ncbi:Lrp/AsnC ligand binding domain-containing protein, partial [Candidatus Bathyarchaeota archaeon]|nr:Lrp/AsnC ligand binding domain-containing protein [Candidatus Bathyarchaeota archaeon]
VNAELGMASEITKTLEDVNEITNIHGLFGLYDLIIEIEGDDMDRIKEVALNKIRRLDNVKSTITLLTYGESFINE